MNNTYNVEDRNCPVCNSNKKELLFSQSFSGITESNLLSSYEVVSCNECGFCFADKIPGQERFDKYYRDLSKYESNTEEYKPSPYDLKRFGIMVPVIKEFLDEPDLHIVEVGCATGLLLSLIKKEGFNNITGIDPSPGCTETARKNYGIKVLTRTLSEIDLAPDSVDFLILVGVLEHVKDLDSSLEKLRNVLSENGKLYIAVPDASQYYKGEDAPFQEFSVEHINFFGPASLSNLMKKNGFSTVTVIQKMAEVNHRTITPVLQAVFSKNFQIEAQSIFSPDVQTKDNLVTYIQICNDKEKAVKSAIEKVVDKEEPIIIWGTGAQTLRLLANSKLGEAKIEAFVDSNPKYQGQSLNGIPIISPTSVIDKKEPILISTRPYQNEIEQQIREVLKLKNEVIKLY
ncbi:MAG: class I SAM-dependent methyltransferase [Segetibacter sp.]